jgi:hypothetical protein
MAECPEADDVLRAAVQNSRTGDQMTLESGNWLAMGVGLLRLHAEMRVSGDEVCLYSEIDCSE